LTLHTAIVYLDRVLSLYETRKRNELLNNEEPTKVGRYSLELAAIGCIFIASKYDELDNNIPFLKDFIKAAKYMFKYGEIIKEEMRLVALFDWKLMVLSPLHFVYSLLSMGVIFSDDQYKNEEKEVVEMDEATLKKVRKGTEYFSDLSAKLYDMQKYPPSMVAAACVLCSRRVNKIHPQRNPLLSKLFQFPVDSPALLECYRTLIVNYKEISGVSEEELGVSFTKELFEQK
jgi:hypothetical protein